MITYSGFQLTIKRVLILGLLCILTGLGLYSIDSYQEIKTEIIPLKVTPDKTLMMRVYFPSQVKTPYPTMILCHGVNSSKEMMTSFALELSRHQIASVTFDFGGWGESYQRSFSRDENLQDLKLIVEYVRSNPQQFNAKKLGLLGHSMGGETVLLFTEMDADIQSSIIIGMDGLATPYLPPNLFMGIGLYEELHPPSVMKEMLDLATNHQGKVGETYGDFKITTARKLYISPTSDHLIEPYDFNLIREVVNWGIQSFGLPVNLSEYKVNRRLISQFLIMLGSLLISLGLTQLRGNKKFIYSVSCLVIIIHLIVGILLKNNLITGYLATDILLCSYLISLFVNYQLTQKSFLWLNKGIFLGGVIAVSFLIPIILTSIGELITYPTYGLGLPQFLLQMGTNLWLNSYQQWKMNGFLFYSFEVKFHVIFILVWLIEILFPSVTFRFIHKIYHWTIVQVSRPISVKLTTNYSQKSLWLLGGLMIVLAGLLGIRFNQGLLTTLAIQSTLMLGVKNFFIPIILLILIIRHPLLRKWLRVS